MYSHILMIQKSYKSFDYKFYGDFSKKQINEFVKTQQKDFNKILKFLKIKKINSRLKYKVYSTLQKKRDGVSTSPFPEHLVYSQMSVVA